MKQAERLKDAPVSSCDEQMSAGERLKLFFERSAAVAVATAAAAAARKQQKAGRGRPLFEEGYSIACRETAKQQALELFDNGDFTKKSILKYAEKQVQPRVDQWKSRDEIVTTYRSKSIPCLGLRICYAIECIQEKEEKHQSDAAVRRLCGVSHSVIVKLKQSTDPGSSDKRRRAVLEKISRVSGLSVDWLMCGTGGPPVEIQRLL